MAVRVLIVDDHEPFRVWAAKLLRAGGMEVVGEAATASRAVVAAAASRPDVVLLDVRLPDGDGFTVCRALSATGLTVVLCSAALTERDCGDLVEQSGRDRRTSHTTRDIASTSASIGPTRTSMIPPLRHRDRNTGNGRRRGGMGHQG